VDEKPGRRQLIGGLAMVVGGSLGFWAYYPEDLDETGRGIPMGLALPQLVVLGLWLVWRGWRVVRESQGTAHTFRSNVRLLADAHIAANECVPWRHYSERDQSTSWTRDRSGARAEVVSDAICDAFGVLHRSVNRPGSDGGSHSTEG
jgi:hypothetical protein